MERVNYRDMVSSANSSVATAHYGFTWNYKPLSIKEGFRLYMTAISAGVAANARFDFKQIYVVLDNY